MFKSQTLMKQQQLIENLTRENETLRQRLETFERGNRLLRSNSRPETAPPGTEEGRGELPMGGNRALIAEAKRAVETRCSALLKRFGRSGSKAGNAESPSEMGRNIDTLLDEVERFRRSVRSIRNLSRELERLGVDATMRAAEAGEHGQGFLLAADAISKLSSHSRENVEEAVRQLRLFTEISRTLCEDFGRSVATIEKNLEGFEALEALLQKQLQKEERETSDRM